MRLVETDTGFVVKPDRATPERRAFAQALLEFLRLHGMPFVIGGSMADDILTIQPLSALQRGDLKAWWLAWEARAGTGPQ